MALKALMLNHKRNRLQTERNAIPDRSAEFATRQAQLEKAIGEATTEEEEAVVTAEVEAFEQERDAHNAEIARLDGEIADLTRQIQEAEAAEPPAPPASAPTDPNHPTTAPPEERKDDNIMPNTRGRYFGMTRSQFADLVKQDDNAKLISQIRESIRNQRSISGGELTISESFLGLIRENVPLYSKLYKHTYARHLKGTGRMNVMGSIPEGVWTEMCASLNELTLTFSNVELDGYKVGGFVAVCNALLEDSDINMAREILDSIIKSIALGLDKAIAYGTGTKMPMGIFTRLAQTAKPDNYKNSIPWKDLSKTHLVALKGLTGMELFKKLLSASGEINTDYGTGEIFWAMNRKTKMKLMAESLGVNASGAIVAGMNDTMPVVGGDIETLSFFPNDVLLVGGDGLYALLERAGVSLRTFDQTRAIQDQTLFIGTGRYDGIPVIAEGFMGISLGDTAPTATAVTFTAPSQDT